MADLNLLLSQLEQARNTRNEAITTLQIALADNDTKERLVQYFKGSKYTKEWIERKVNSFPADLQAPTLIKLITALNEVSDE